MGTRRPAVATFDPLLRDLVLWGLVHQVAGDDGLTWQLRPEVQDRLAEVVAARGTPPADRLLYLGRHCITCGKRALTRLSPRGYVCEACLLSEANRQAVVGAVEPPPDRQPKRRHSRRKGRGNEGAPPLAS